jgi:secreted Zn-dependent insulinase-like peptidase
VELFFQVPGNDSIENRVMLSALEHLMREPLYAELRSTQQLGYSVKCGARSVCGSLGFVVEITSDKHGPEVLAQDVDQFFMEFRENIATQMSIADFVTNMCSLGSQILQKPQNLSEAAASIWSNIATHIFYGTEYSFDAHVGEANYLRYHVTKTRFLDFFDKWLHPNSTQRRRASVYVVGRGYQPEKLISMLIQENNLVKVHNVNSQQQHNQVSNNVVTSTIAAGTTSSNSMYSSPYGGRYNGNGNNSRGKLCIVM